MNKSPRIPWSQIRKMAVEAEVGEKSIQDALAQKPMKRMRPERIRAEFVLRKHGYLTAS